jgi:predicted Zn-dependent protease with MMP-like domain
LVESPSHRFDGMVLDAIEHVEPRWRHQLAAVEFAVEDVPAAAERRSVAEEIVSAGVPLARLLPAEHGEPPRIVVYRRPLELRARDREDLEDLVHDIVVEQIAHFLGLDPGVVDPGWDDGPG